MVASPQKADSEAGALAMLLMHTVGTGTLPRPETVVSTTME